MIRNGNNDIDPKQMIFGEMRYITRIFKYKIKLVNLKGTSIQVFVGTHTNFMITCT